MLLVQLDSDVKASEQEVFDVWQQEMMKSATIPKKLVIDGMNHDVEYITPMGDEWAFHENATTGIGQNQYLGKLWITKPSDVHHTTPLPSNEWVNEQSFKTFNKLTPIGGSF